MDNLVIERLEMVVDQAADDLGHLSAGEHVERAMGQKSTVAGWTAACPSPGG